jgi:hypothetical protein
MSNLKIKSSSNTIRLLINNDKNKVIEFDPEDSSFANRYYTMIANFDQKKDSFIKKAAEIDKIDEVNSFGIQVKLVEESKLIVEMFNYMCEQIDYVFGKGTSEMAFDNVAKLELIDQFLSGITEHVLTIRNSKMKKYLNSENGVMKN